jgi:uncharacterized protein (DUF4415 family)
MLQDQVGVKRVRMSEHEVAEALTTYSLRAADVPRVLSQNNSAGTEKNIARSSKAPKNAPGERTAKPRTAPKTAKLATNSAHSPALKPQAARGSKQARTLSLDADVLAFFTAGGRGASSRINAALRLAMDLATALQPQSLAQA